MKVLYYLRHSLKDYNGPNEKSKGRRTGKEGFELAQKLGKVFKEIFKEKSIIITDFFAGELPRTWETLAGFLAGYKPTVEVLIHQHLEIGDQDIFSQYITAEVKQLINNGHTNWQALKKVLGKRKIEKFKKFAFQGVEEAFKRMKGETGIIFGHSPIIEAAAEYVGFLSNLPDWQPNSCEGYIFILDNDYIKSQPFTFDA